MFLCRELSCCLPGFLRASKKYPINPVVIDHQAEAGFRSIDHTGSPVDHCPDRGIPEPMIRLLVIKAPNQWVKLIISVPAMPGKKYLFPPEKPTTSWEEAGPQMMRRSYSKMILFKATGTSFESNPSERTWISSAGIVPMVAKTEEICQR